MNKRKSASRSAAAEEIGGRGAEAAAIRAAGYGAVWHGQKSWNGVTILARGAEPMETRRGLPGDPDDTQSRYIEAAIGDTLVGCLYMPNGNPAPGPLNSRYFRPVRRKETRARRWDLQFESTSLQRRVGSELDFRQIMTAPAMTPFHIRRITSRLRAVSAVRRALAD